MECEDTWMYMHTVYAYAPKAYSQKFDKKNCAVYTVIFYFV